jgi:hypothetical protein
MQSELFTPVRDQCGTTRTHAHTPGPWRVFDIFTDLEIVTDSPTAEATESLVQFKGQRNARANARLMAAAPDLLAALQTAANTWGETFATGAPVSGADLVAWFAGWLESVRPVLAAAEGRQP